MKNRKQILRTDSLWNKMVIFPSASDAQRNIPQSSSHRFSCKPSDEVVCSTMDPDLARIAEGLTRTERLEMATTLENWAKQLRSKAFFPWSLS